MNEWVQRDNKVLFYPQERIILYMEDYLKSFAYDSSSDHWNLLSIIIKEKNNTLRILVTFLRILNTIKSN